jgi:hypothetical protein
MISYDEQHDGDNKANAAGDIDIGNFNGDSLGIAHTVK